jgi:hypothetical protein
MGRPPTIPPETKTRIVLAVLAAGFRSGRRSKADGRNGELHCGRIRHARVYPRSPSGSTAIYSDRARDAGTPRQNEIRNSYSLRLEP